mmetsp:Transcript_53860/g.128012  ORF Transcript_53860/g.128012 Transcript_53860/m.128012 type:complete len:1454 (-) Transcript_53860:172-4533(-)
MVPADDAAMHAWALIAIEFVIARWCASVLHEGAHILSAAVLGFPREALTLSNLRSALFSREVAVKGLPSRAAAVVRHSGWLASFALAVVAGVMGGEHGAAWRLAVYVTSLEAASSDLLGIGAGPGEEAWRFRCGNFGILLLDPEYRAQALSILRTMVRVTMMRGAQSGGVVHYAPLADKEGTKGAAGVVGIRSRVVNGKRTDLSQLVSEKLGRDAKVAARKHGSLEGPLFYAGHTRFATSSKATMDGTHPHQWTPPAIFPIWSKVPGQQWQCAPRSVEVFICHNGDLDSFEVGGRDFALDAVMDWIERATHVPRPSSVDSAGVAGLIDLLRTKGSWFHSMRFGYLFGPKRTTLSYSIPEESSFQAFAEAAEDIFRRAIPQDSTVAGVPFSGGRHDNLRVTLVEGLFEKLSTCHCDSRLRTLRAAAPDASPISLNELEANPPPPRGAPPPLSSCSACVARRAGLLVDNGQLRPMVEAGIDGFFDQDLLAATRLLLAGAKGSFGLCINSSLDASRQVVVAARGQTLSIAFYPRSGILLWGSEQAAVKAAMQVHGSDVEDQDQNAVRLDLDDLGGEVCLIDWGSPELGLPTNIMVEETVVVEEDEGDGTPLAAGDFKDRSESQHNKHFKTVVQDRGSQIEMELWAAPRRHQLGCVRALGLPQRASVMGGKATVTLVQESLGKRAVFRKRMVHLAGNPLILPLPPAVPDAVGADIADIPAAMARIQDDWDSGNSFNRLTAWTLGRALCDRLRRIQNRTHDGSVDILITGCEVSLWLGEQFASDLSQVFPALNIKVISSNKLLGLLGQDFPIPQSGHQLHEGSWNLDSTICIVISHSGGTFGPLAVSNLLQAVTKNIFVVASEWDTQIGKQLRQMRSAENLWEIKSFIFSTFVGIRPAEPCTVSVAATHQLLTQILLYLMQKIQLEKLDSASGGDYLPDDCLQLDHQNHANITAIEEIVGYKKDGTVAATDTSRDLRATGARWGQHVLEGVHSWVLSFIYIFATVISGYPLCLGIAKAAGLNPDLNNGSHVLLFLDSVLYMFCAQWTCLLLRIVQRRPLRHRMTARPIVIGDIPWVAQSLEAYVSKLFACAYSASSVNVWSANPADHLVHRHTHRVVRGGLVACGRPDGRLIALTSAENAVCLSVNQASSIQSLGSTCESITIGHNPYKLPLTKHAIFLNGSRKMFLSEYALVRNDEEAMRAPKARKGKHWDMLSGLSSGALMGEYSNMKKVSKEENLPLVQGRQTRSRAGSHLAKVSEMEEGVAASPVVAVAASRQAVSGVGLYDAESELVIEALGLSQLSNRKGELNSAKRKKLLNYPYLGAFQDHSTHEQYYGEKMQQDSGNDAPVDRLIELQVISMRLYETRIASLQRCVAFMVLFHQMGKNVADFWSYVSFGLLGYDMSRTHSIMRIATTASPVSGAEVRARTLELARGRQIHKAMATLRKAVHRRRSLSTIS